MSTGSTAPWTNFWGADRVMRYDPQDGGWTAFDLPTRGAEPRYVSLLERDGRRRRWCCPISALARSRS